MMISLRIRFPVGRTGFQRQVLFTQRIELKQYTYRGFERLEHALFQRSTRG
jgi:hypothetical protein